MVGMARSLCVSFPTVELTPFVADIYAVISRV